MILTNLETVHMRRYMQDPAENPGKMIGLNFRTTGGKIRDTFRFLSKWSIDTDAMTPPITPTTPISPKEYDIMEVREEDDEDIFNFLRQTFFRDEPLNNYLELVTDENPICEDLEKFVGNDMYNGLGLKAVHNGNIIGVCLNGLLERGVHDKDNLVITDRNFSKVYRLLERVSREFDVFSRFPDCDKGMTMKIISVSNAYRGQGIAKELMNRTRNMAKELGAGFMAVDCTSHFTALALKKLGFELAYSLKYADHKENGQVVFKPEPPHEAVTVYVQKI